MKATRFAVRDLGKWGPDDYPNGGFDVIAHCDDGTMRHCDGFFDTRDEAEIALAGYELKQPDDLHQWEVTIVSETDCQ